MVLTGSCFIKILAVLTFCDISNNGSASMMEKKVFQTVFVWRLTDERILNGHLVLNHLNGKKIQVNSSFSKYISSYQPSTISGNKDRFSWRVVFEVQRSGWVLNGEFGSVRDTLEFIGGGGERRKQDRERRGHCERSDRWFFFLNLFHCIVYFVSGESSFDKDGTPEFHEHIS